MHSSTHAAVGAATALAVACAVVGDMDVTMKMSVLTAGATGGVMADIDLKQSKAARWTKRIIAGCITSFTVASIVQFRESGNLTPLVGARVFVGLVLFIALAIAGMKSPHREKTHSWVFLGLFMIAVWLITSQQIAIAFGFGYLSHLIIDFPNKKGECLLWPMPNRYCLGLCKADGIVNKCLGAIGSIVSLILISM